MLPGSLSELLPSDFQTSSALADSSSVTSEPSRCRAISELSAPRRSSLGSVPWLPTIHQLAYGAAKLRGTCGGRQQQDEEEPEAGPRAPLAAHDRCPGAAARWSLAAPNGLTPAAPRPFLPGGGFPGGSPSSGEAREGKGGGFHILKAPGNICRGCSSSANRRGVRDESRAALG